MRNIYAEIKQAEKEGKIAGWLAVNIVSEMQQRDIHNLMLRELVKQKEEMIKSLTSDKPSDVQRTHGGS